jgi:hypothetical protein
MDKGDIVPLTAFLSPSSPPRARSKASSRDSTVRSLGIGTVSVVSREEFEGGEGEEIDLGQDTSYRGYVGVSVD